MFITLLHEKFKHKDEGNELTRPGRSCWGRVFSKVGALAAVPAPGITVCDHPALASDTQHPYPSLHWEIFKCWEEQARHSPNHLNVCLKHVLNQILLKLQEICNLHPTVFICTLKTNLFALELSKQTVNYLVLDSCYLCPRTFFFALLQE